MTDPEDRPYRLSLTFWIASAVAVAGMLYVGLSGWGWLAVMMVPALVLTIVIAVNTVLVLLAEKKGRGKERGEEDDA